MSLLKIMLELLDSQNACPYIILSAAVYLTVQTKVWKTSVGVLVETYQNISTVLQIAWLI